MNIGSSCERAMLLRRSLIDAARPLTSYFPDDKQKGLITSQAQVFAR
jgi:hypothetical protein